MKTTNTNTTNTAPFQVCFIATDDDGKTTCTATENITAESLADAYADMLEKTDGADNFRIYPLAVADDAESVYRLAEYARKQDKKWRIANDAAAVAAFKETPDDAADALQNAALAIVAALAENAAADMFTVYRAAAALLKSERNKLFRISETEYNPSWAFHNAFIGKTCRQSMPRLAALISAAIDAAALSEKQADVLDLYMRGVTVSAVIERRGISKNAYYSTFYSAVYKVLKTAADMDGADAPTFTRYGITAADVSDALSTYAKRARIK